MTPEQFKQIRKSAGHTQAEFGEMLGLSREHVGQMERGNAAIETRTALAAQSLAVRDVSRAEIWISELELRQNTDAGLRCLLEARLTNARRMAA